MNAPAGVLAVHTVAVDGGGGTRSTGSSHQDGGGVGLFGEGASGVSVLDAGGAGGSGGATASSDTAADGGEYGGGGSGYTRGVGNGACRIIWGTGRSFPNNA